MKYFITKILIAVSLLCVISNSFAQNDDIEDLTDLKSGATAFLQQQYTDSVTPPVISINQLDNRLRLKKCSEPPTYSFKSDARKFGQITVFAKCNGTTPWSLYIPATVTVYQNIIIANQGIFRGTTLTKKHLKLQKADLSRAYYGYYTSFDDVVGMQAGKSIPAGAIITKHFLELPDIIKKGQEVFIQAKTKGINVQLKGKALSNGKQGQLIKVKNISSGKTVQAKVISSTKVEVSID